VCFLTTQITNHITHNHKSQSPSHLDLELKTRALNPLTPLFVRPSWPASTQIREKQAAAMLTTRRHFTYFSFCVFTPPPTENSLGRACCRLLSGQLSAFTDWLSLSIQPMQAKLSVCPRHAVAETWKEAEPKLNIPSQSFHLHRSSVSCPMSGYRDHIASESHFLFCFWRWRNLPKRRESKVKNRRSEFKRLDLPYGETQGFVEERTVSPLPLYYVGLLEHAQIHKSR
jgi:hypothetical protein